MPNVLDDLDSRPGSAPSLLRTVVGAVFRDYGGWVPTRVIVTCLQTVGVPEGGARTALTRVRSRGLLVVERRGAHAGYRLADGGDALLARGDRRIYRPRAMDDAELRWCLISFSIPEAQRDARHQLRRRLTWIGAGIVTPALWLVPDFLREEVAEIVADLGLWSRVTLFSADDTHSAVASTAELVTRWWNLDAIRQLHDDFLRGLEDMPVADALAGRAPADPAVAFAAWIRTLDAWRPIPYRDPGLPVSLLPLDWPGRRSAEAFLAIRDATRVGAAEYVQALINDGAS